MSKIDFAKNAFIRYLLETGSMAKALSLAQEAEILCDVNTKEGKKQLSYLYNTYGVVKLQHDDLSSAKQWFQRAYDIRKEHLGEFDVNTVAVKFNFVLVLLNEKRYTEAIDDLKPLRNLVLNKPDLPTRIASSVYDFLCIACMHLAKLDEAWDYIQISIDMTKDSVPLYSQGSG